MSQNRYPISVTLSEFFEALRRVLDAPEYKCRLKGYRSERIYRHPNRTTIGIVSRQDAHPSGKLSQRIS